MTLLHLGSYYPPPPQGEPPPVRVEISIGDDDDVDRDDKIPNWPYAITVTFIDRSTRGMSGTVEAADRADAEARVYCRTIDLLAELLAERMAATKKAVSR